LCTKKTIPGFELHKGKGDREFSYHIDFDKSFGISPNVFVSFSQLDMINEVDARIFFEQVT